MKRLFVFFTLLCLSLTNVIAQENLKKHTISSGETLSSIAKKYNVTPYELQIANPGVIANLNEGDTLTIPASKIKAPVIKSISDSIRATVKQTSVSYTVKKGDTKYGLSKRFGLTIPELESQNPQIVSGLQTEQVLEIYANSNPNVPAPSTSNSNLPTSATPTRTSSSTEQFYIVKKGETLWGLSQANGLTVNELTNANTDLLSGVLKEGQRLRIPSSGQSASNTNFSTYLVQKGDSKYGLSKKYGVTIAELERENPHIRTMLMAGHTIKIPKPEAATADDTSDLITTVPENAPASKPLAEEEIAETEVERDLDEPVNEKETPTIDNVAETPQRPQTDEQTNAPTITNSDSVSDKQYINYEVKPKETLFGLAKRAGMTMPEFLELNPQLKESVQIGTIIKMPVNGAVTLSDETTPSTALRSTSRYKDLRSTAKSSELKNIIFFLPFSQTEFQNYAVNGYNFDIVSEDFKKRHLEFYKGATIAIDSLRALKLRLNVEIVETLTNQRNSKIMDLAEAHNINKYDAIVVPFYDSVEEDIADYTVERNIPVITASTIAHQSNTNNLYSALPSINQQRLKVLNYIKQNQAHIIVLSDVNRSESKAFIENHVPATDFVNIRKNGTFNEEELISKFRKNQLNVVVIDSERNSVFLSATTTMLTELSNYKLQLAVLESGLIPDGDDVSTLRFRILKMIYPSLTPAAPTENSKQFIKTYQKNYNLLPTSNVMLGFDITFDSLLRMLQQESFQHSAENDTTEYTQLKFDYEKNTLGGFSNEGIYILQYDSEANLKEAN
ncbi:LysM domain-containing protein [Gelidibacter sediminis]|uniref:LysM domain-containing protein n=1 Tax=Gelidibacter sediminis TaxID=1608710 RepID=A0A4R7PXR2_9FLAO|nr:LysM peptidoglycan-binding domain-containing protein [Gelidibacter sediminis]TDU39757.1 LysM domain-containing protein [Gelidibacter sediminis]